MLLALTRAVALYGAATAIDAARQAGRRAGVTVGLKLTVAALFAVSLGFMSFAAYRALEQGLGAIFAALILAGCYLVAALIMLLAIQRRG